jgi:hypothetical protein
VAVDEGIVVVLAMFSVGLEVSKYELVRLIRSNSILCDDNCNEL